ncbi:hypothetical protein [Crocosphaera subtropica]|uniref:hypothetical protein n=1 Tax=Crocosphaera subtropica TaxID=2546360 RepID=UPI0002313C20|nr:hypothetical protein [Crocosphaera subtropica]
MKAPSLQTIKENIFYKIDFSRLSFKDLFFLESEFTHLILRLVQNWEVTFEICELLYEKKNDFVKRYQVMDALFKIRKKYQEMYYFYQKSNSMCTSEEIYAKVIKSHN